MHILSFSLILRIGCYRHQEMFAPALSHCILGTADTRLESGAAIFSQQAEQVSPGRPPRPRPLHADPHGPWEGQGGHLHGGAGDQPPSCSRLGDCSSEPGPPPSRGGPRFLGLLPASTGIQGTRTSHSWCLSSLRLPPHPALNSCGFCFGPLLLRLFSV